MCLKREYFSQFCKGDSCSFYIYPPKTYIECCYSYNMVKHNSICSGWSYCIFGDWSIIKESDTSYVSTTNIPQVLE